MGSKSVENDIYFNLLPVRREERIYGFWDMLAIQINFGIAAWLFLTGGITGLVLPAKESIPTIVFGNTIALFLISPLAVMFARYGVEQHLASKAVFGYRGYDLWLIIFITSSFGPMAYAAILMGSAAWKLVELLGISNVMATEHPGREIWAVLATLAGAYIAYKGPRFLSWTMRIGAALLIGILLYFIYFVVAVAGFQKIFSTPPPKPMDTVGWSRATALEWNVANGFAWAFWYGQWVRLAKTESAAYHGTLWGWSILSSIAAVFAALTATVVGSFDPTDWVIQTNIPLITLLALIMIIWANTGSIATLIYPMSITLRTRFPNIGWAYVVALMALGGIIMDITPGLFEAWGIYLGFLGMLCGIYGAILVGDYLMHRARWRMREIYDLKGGYIYWRGFNLSALVATIVGVVFYLLILDPLSWTSFTGLFPYITASLPTFMLTLAVYVMLTKSGVFNRFYTITPGLEMLGIRKQV